VNGLRQFVKINKRASDWLSAAFPRVFSGGYYRTTLLDILHSHLDETKNAKYVLEAGGIDRPLLQRQKGIIYDGLDIEAKPACHAIYDHFFVQSVESEIAGTYDVIASITLLEHVRDNVAAMQSIYRALNADGMTAHYIPSKYHPYAILLGLMGPSLQRALIARLRPWAMKLTGHRAYFDHCSPRSMTRLMTKTGYTAIKTICFYRANDYFSFFVPLFVLVSLYENICRLLGAKQLCSGFIITAKRPVSGANLQELETCPAFKTAPPEDHCP